MNLKKYITFLPKEFYTSTMYICVGGKVMYKGLTFFNFFYDQAHAFVKQVKVCMASTRLQISANKMFRQIFVVM